MSPQFPLTGAVLIDCAKANAKAGVANAAMRCGYGDRTADFLNSVKQAGSEMGIKIAELDDLITQQQQSRQGKGIEIAPDTTGKL